MQNTIKYIKESNKYILVDKEGNEIKDLILDFEFHDHKYTLVDSNGEVQWEPISTTTLMSKHGLGVNYDDVLPDILERAKLFGQVNHAWLEKYFKGEASIDEVNQITRNGVKLLNEQGFAAITNEFMVHNHLVSGMIDMIAMKEDVLVMMDYKFTYNFNHVSIRWQLNIYAKLLKEMTGMEVKELYCLWYNKPKRTFEIRKVGFLDDKLLNDLFHAEMNNTIFVEGQNSALDIIASQIAFEKEIDKYNQAKSYFNQMEVNFTTVKEQMEIEMDTLGITNYDTEKYSITRVLPTDKRKGYILIRERNDIDD